MGLKLGGWGKIFETLLNASDRLNILVNNAGGAIRVASMALPTGEEIPEIFSLNLSGHLFGARRAAAMIKIMQPREMGMLVLTVCTNLPIWYCWT